MFFTELEKLFMKLSGATKTSNTKPTFHYRSVNKLNNVAVWAYNFFGIFHRQLFLNVGEGVNVIAHGLSYLLGLFAVFPNCLIAKVSILNTNKK
jgi:hypothetical protein